MMVQHSISRILPTLTGRPPTPPRESEAKHPDLFGRLFTTTTSKDFNSQTPDITPQSSNQSPKSLNQIERSKKRVAWDDGNDKPILEINAALTVGDSTGERKPIKSILKPYNGNSIQISLPSKLSPPHTYANLAAMLESVAQQLAGKDRSSKMDAYTTLSGVLKASDNVPDVRALKEKMGLLQQFIRRDLAAKNPSGALDTALIVNALILLSIFLHRPAIAEYLTADFCIYLVDHTIRTFEDPTMTKDVVKHLMLILAEQKFSAKIMNGERVGRLVTSLKSIENYVKGKSIVMGRINIYRTLVRQSMTHMLVNTDWVSDIFGDMFSSFRETKASAIALGLESGLVLGTESKASRAFMELFSSSLRGNDEVRFGEYYAGRLKTMIQEKEDAPSVPQIWSVPILFLRCKPRQFEQWAFMQPWLEIIQLCFNCSDQQTKFEANLAWNRLVYAVQPDEKTSSQMINILYQPLREQFRRKGKGRKAAFGSLCNLLYYSLKPAATSVQLNLYWDRYIVEIVGKALAPRKTSTITPPSTRQDLMEVCSVLTSLFDSGTPRPWQENRAMDPCAGKDISMEASELPALDSKWLRKSASRVFPIINPILEKLYWDLGEKTETVTVLWKAYITSIASPAVKEVKVSNETMSCVACIFGLLYKIWQRGAKSIQAVPPPEGLSEDFLSSFETIISTTIEGLGPLPFTQKLLSVGSEDEFVVIATPSHVPRKARGEPRCPLHHLIVLLTTVSPDLEYDRNFSHLVRQIIFPFFDARPSKRAKLDLIKDLLDLLPPENNEPCRMIWSVLAELATFATDTRDEVNNGANGVSDQPLGADYRSAIKILEFGIEVSPTDPLPGWKTLFEALVTSATIDAGNGGRAIAVIEPLGRILRTKFSNIDGQLNSRGSFYLRALLSKATYPKDRQALDAARRRLWGAAAAKTSSFDPYTFLYDYMRESLQKAYTSFANGLILEYSDMIVAMTTLLNHCPTPLLTNTLITLQSGVASWIRDESSRINGGTVLAHSIISMWSKICQVVPSLARLSNHSKLLADLEILICSGLESRHRSLVNSSVRLWNSTFGASKEHLTYPMRIKDALLRLRSVAELQLPFFPESLESDGIVDQRQVPNFAEAQDTSSDVFGSVGVDSILRVLPTPQLGISPTSSSRLKNYTPQVVIEAAQSVLRKRPQESTPDSKTRKSRKRSIAPKLRHDDSQIQFEAIESSPIADTALDSQLLTDRQKEVKDRQQAEAAMFPNLRSSPRPKEKAWPGPNAELPLHRSASKSRTTASPVNKRQATPTLVPQGEYDDYVNSSPTPTRALQRDVNLPDPPSSPPEVAKEQTRTYIEDEVDVPSSPPEMHMEVEHYATASLDASAQVDPYAEENIPILSTFESTSNQQKDPMMEAAALTQTPKSAVLNEIFVTEPNIDQSRLVSELTEIEAPVVDVPGTPIRCRGSSPTLFHTPKSTRSEEFHDTQTSPRSSDNYIEGEDAFQDTYSSPRLNSKKARKQRISSPISFINDSSMLRMIEPYDQGSGRPRRSDRFVISKEHQGGSVSPSSLKALPQPTVSMDRPSDTMADGTELLFGPKCNIGKAFDKIPPLPVENEENSSSLPSLIPETPGPTRTMNLQIVDGEEIDLDDTIVVDDSVLQEQEPSVFRGRKRKSDINADKAESPAFKKRRHEEVAIESGVGSRQGTKPEIFSPKTLMTPKKRKKLGSPKGKAGFQVSSLTNSEAQPDSSQTSSFDHESLLQVMEATTEGITSSANEVMEEEIFKTTQAVAEVMASELEHEVDVQPLNEERSGDKTSYPQTNEDKNISDIDMVADTVIGEISGLEESGSVPIRQEIETREENILRTSRIIMTSSEPVEEVLPARVDTSVQTDIVVEAPSAQGLKNKLQSILHDLCSVALNRVEMYELEDLFMDAKELLYGAGRRGRVGS